MLTLDALYHLLPPDRLERLASAYEIDSSRRVRLSGPAVLLCLLNGVLNHPMLTLRLLEETYRQQTGLTVDHSSFGKCLARLPVGYFADIFTWLRGQLAPQFRPADARVLRVRIVDATLVTLSAKLLHWGLYANSRVPDKAHRAVKSVFELDDDGLPRLLRVCQDPAENADSVALGATMLKHTRPGDLWVFDKGCHGRDRLLALHQADAYWLTPHTQQGFRVDRTLFEADPSVQPQRAPGPDEPTSVLLGAQAGVFQNSRTLHKWEAMPVVMVHGVRWEERTRRWKPLVVMTNLPLAETADRAGPYTLQELMDLYRQRWQIETFFKFLKQHLSFSHLTSRSENGIHVLIYTALIAALLMMWYQKQTGIDRGWRSVKFWLAENVRVWTQQCLASEPIALDPG